MSLSMNDDFSSGEEPSLHTAETALSDMRKLRKVIRSCYPKALPALEAALAVIATGFLEGIDRCVALILVGVSGVGKTLPLNLILPQNSDAQLSGRFYRSDGFTARSFVSHKADEKPENLAKIDLLPRIKDKNLVTLELAPLFRGKRDDLIATFAVLTRVLDGDGYQTDSGAQGRRGYEGKHVFRWLGATTPLDAAAVEVMGHLGPRLLFFETIRAESGDEEFAKAVFGTSPEGAFATAKEAAQCFLHKCFERCSTPIDIGQIEFPSDLQKPLLDSARMLVRLRAPIRREEGIEKGVYIEEVQTELPDRAAQALRYLAEGRAVLWGRSRVNANDLRFVRHVALSSGVPGRQRIMKALIKVGGETSLDRLEHATDRTRPYVDKYVGQLQSVGLTKVREGGGRGNPTVVSIDDGFKSVLLNRRQPRERLNLINLKRDRSEREREAA
jgi:hypothetical protein